MTRLLILAGLRNASGSHFGEKGLFFGVGM
jgi:hypothetical protein